jgi:hypothetical protein
VPSTIINYCIIINAQYIRSYCIIYLINFNPEMLKEENVGVTGACILIVMYFLLLCNVLFC